MNYKKGTQTRGCMKSVMRYVSQLSKTLWDGQQLVSGIGCQPETAFDEFLSTKLLHHKDGGVMFYHMVQSFPKGANIDPRTAHEAARQLAGYFEGCEVLVCTHTDREHIHSHCIINSVNFETGKKVHIADKQIQELRVCNDQICEELGLPKFQRDEQKHSRGMSNAEYYTASKGESWKFELMRVIDECMRCAGNREEFLILLRSEGYDAMWTDSRKNITYTTPEGRKCRDSKLHISPADVAEFIERATAQEENYAAMKDRLQAMTANDFFRFCAMGYAENKYDGCGKTPKEQYVLHADGRDEGLQDIDADSPEAFHAWLHDRDRCGGHPWEVCRGGNSTHVDLRVMEDMRGYFLYLAGAAWNRTMETVKFYLALTRANIPVYLAEAKMLADRLAEEEKIGIVPEGVLPAYCGSWFPNEHIIDYMNLPSEDREKFLPFCTWYEERPAALAQREET